MAVLTILHYPDERLKQISQPVTVFDDELQRFIADLLETMRAAPGCVGLAAPQVNDFRRVVIVDVSNKKDIPHHGCMVLINPEIVASSGSAVGREGCLSVPDYTGNVSRAEHVRVRSHDPAGQPYEFECSGYEARAVQHEMDHLDGLLFLDRLVSHKRDLFRRKVYKQKEE
jgi:peptide deformylase